MQLLTRLLDTQKVSSQRFSDRKMRTTSISRESFFRKMRNIFSALMRMEISALLNCLELLNCLIPRKRKQFLSRVSA
ncbi:MAG: hypothetical protein AB2L14_29135 [Candidatus Xenobiia bacterium LiM19]